MRCIVIDFDGTLSYFRSGSTGFSEIFTKRGVLKNIIQENYELLKAKEGFSIQGLCDLLVVSRDVSLDSKAIEKEFEEWVEGNLVVYPESIGAIEYWRAKHIPVIILTAGEKKHQRQKVRMSKIPHDELCIVQRAEEKALEIKRLIQAYGTPLAVLDDRAAVLDAIRKEFPNRNEVQTFWIRRPGFLTEKAEYEHVEIPDLLSVTWNEEKKGGV